MTAIPTKPDSELWNRINDVMLGANADVALATLQSGMSMLLVHAGLCRDELQARAHLAAMFLSPHPGGVGLLLPMLDAELEALRKGEASRVTAWER